MRDGLLDQIQGGTRHGTMQFYRQNMSTEDVMRLSAHTTSKAGLRYIQIQEEELRRGFAMAGGTPSDERTREVHSKAAHKVSNLSKP